jgi:hypothetical protein
LQTSAPRLRAPPAHGGAGRLSSIFPDELFLIHRGGVSLETAGFIAQNRGLKESMNHHYFIQFTVEMSSKFPFFVPVAAGIVGVFMTNLTVFCCRKTGREQSENRNIIP